MKTFTLHGIETDNLLGFLALLGLLRALENARPQWSPRAHFAGVPLRAVLSVNTECSEEQVAAAASEGCAAFTPAFDFGEFTDLNFGAFDATGLLKKSSRTTDAAFVMSALCSDGAYRRDTARIIATPLCAMFGQGWQSFLSRLKSVAAGTLPKKLQTKKNPPALNDPAYIYRALFEPWQRNDQTEAFRWDYAEDRQYALRFADPSSEAPRTEHGANRLAVLGLLSFQSAPSIRGVNLDLKTRAVSRGRTDRRPRITWPIWQTPASIEAINMLLDERELTADEPQLSKVARFDIAQARRVYRIKRGKFFNFSRAEAII